MPTTDQTMDLAPVIDSSMLTSQGTVELMSRAVAEVQAQVVVARRFPRNPAESSREALAACQRPSMAEQAFYSYRRGGNQITGPTVQLMRELARCWTNVQSGIVELNREPGRSEMMAFAWDLQKNTRMTTTFFVNHTRDRKGEGGVKEKVDLDDDRDIYENNANLGARRERAMLQRILPAWYVEECVAECYRTLAAGTEDIAAFQKRLDKAVERFGVWGVRQEHLEERLGVPRTAWTPVDFATLTVLFRTIERHETTIAEEFPTLQGRGSAASTLAQAAQQQDAKGKGDAGEDLTPPPPAHEDPGLLGGGKLAADLAAKVLADDYTPSDPDDHQQQVGWLAVQLQDAGLGSWFVPGGILALIAALSPRRRNPPASLEPDAIPVKELNVVNRKLRTLIAEARTAGGNPVTAVCTMAASAGWADPREPAQ